MTNDKPTRYDWSRVSQETSQALIQAIHDFDQASVPDGKEHVQVKNLLEEARLEAAICECTLPERDVLLAAHEYFQAFRCSMSHSQAWEDAKLEQLRLRIEVACK